MISIKKFIVPFIAVVSFYGCENLNSVELSSANSQDNVMVKNVSGGCVACRNGDENQLGEIVSIHGQGYVVKNIWGIVTHLTPGTMNLQPV
ncbi:MAG: hypothetical protein OCC49_17750 [Fibrobacterales bacterium]